MNTQNLLTKRNIIGLIIALVLLITIPLGIYLAQKTQIFKPRATEETPSASAGIKVTGSGVNCSGEGCTVTGDKVDLELTSPLGPPQPSDTPSASSSPAASSLPSASPSPSASPAG